MLQPHAVIALPNNIEIDARAHRNGLALAAAGFRVTMVGYGTGIPPTGTISGLPYFLEGGPQPGGRKLSLVYRTVRKAFHVTTRRRPPQEVLKAVAKVDAATARAKDAARALVDRARRPAPELAVDPTSWQARLPFIADMEEAMFARIVELQPDVIVCDVHLLHLATLVADRLKVQGRRAAVVYDAREYVYGLASDDPNVLEGFPALEAEHIGRCDGVVTVCEPIADFLREKYDLPYTPPLVPNAPLGDLPVTHRPMTIRDFLRIDPEAPLLVYAGGLSVHRGVHDAVSALAELPGVHLAVGARRPSSYTLELEMLADRLGVRDRFHFVPFAPTHEVAEYLASATAAVFPFLPVGNHVWAAPNKYFESVQARLPILTSNMEWLGERITRLGIGEVFEHSNPASLAEAARKVLGDLDTYRARITDELVHEHTFEYFEHVIKDMCVGTLTAAQAQALRPASLTEHLKHIRRDMLGQRAALADSELFEPRPRLRIGTANSAGQPRLWAQALMAEHPEAMAESVWLARRADFTFPVDEVMTETQAHTQFYLRQLMKKFEDRITHVLSESGRPMLGSRFGKYFWQESAWLAEHGIRQGLVFHGSDIRNPRRHAELEPESPFGRILDEEATALVATLQRRVEHLTPHVLAFDGPVFVTTHDLLDHLPDATWLPLVVDTDRWAPTAVPLAHGRAPMVFHSPNKPFLKGSAAIDAACLALQSQGLIRYVREQELDPDEMHAAVSAADIVIDQLRLGDYGVTAIEAMSAGKVVVGHVADRIREQIPGDLPVVQATETTLPEVLRELIADRERCARLGAAGRDYALEWHDGRRAASVLAGFMGL